MKRIKLEDILSKTNKLIALIQNEINDDYQDNDVRKSFFKKLQNVLRFTYLNIDSIFIVTYMQQGKKIKVISTEIDEYDLKPIQNFGWIIADPNNKWLSTYLGQVRSNLIFGSYTCFYSAISIIKTKTIIKDEKFTNFFKLLFETAINNGYSESDAEYNNIEIKKNEALSLTWDNLLDIVEQAVENYKKIISLDDIKKIDLIEDKTIWTD